MAGLFVSQSGKDLERIEKAFQFSNFNDVAAAAHSMKSTAAYMGFGASLGEVLKKLELEARDKMPDHDAMKALFEKVGKLRREAVAFVKGEFLT
jgi:HPt (histidine-containing phosphotransfer) domain-containing protein